MGSSPRQGLLTGTCPPHVRVVSMRIRLPHAAQIDQTSADLVRAPAKQRDAFALLIAHGDVVHAGALASASAPRRRRQLIAEARRRRKSIARSGGDRDGVVGVAGERERTVGEREDQSAVAQIW